MVVHQPYPRPGGNRPGSHRGGGPTQVPILPPTALGPAPTTDGAAFYRAGVPLVNFLTAPFYLFDAQDTLDKIHRPSLVPVTRATVRIIESTAAQTARAMREAQQN